MADYVDLPDRRALLMVGTWNASTGTEPITDEDLAEIVRAYESGVLDNPVIKRGHLDVRFRTHLEDGTPAYGTITDLEVEDGVLYGRYRNMPADLAESLDSAYPRSSVELARNVVIRDQEGEILHEFGCVLTANALLGETAPAVKGLSTKMSDLARLSSGTTEYIELPIAQFSAVRAALPGNHTAQALAEKLGALVNDRFSSEVVWGYLEDFDDEVVYAAVSDGSAPVVYRQAYTVDDNGQPELTGEPVQVIKETKWVAEGERVAASEYGDLGDPGEGHTWEREITQDDEGNLIPGPAKRVKKENTDDTATVHPAAPELAQPMSEDTPTPPPDSQGETTMAVDKEKAAELRKQYGLKSTSSTDELLAKIIEEKERGKSVAPGSDETPNPEVAEQQADEFEGRFRPYLSEGEDGEQDGTPTRRDVTDDEEEEEGPAIAKRAQNKAGKPATATAKHNSHGRPATVNGEEKFSEDSVKVSPVLLSEMQSRLSSAEARLAAREQAETAARRDGYIRQWYKDGLISDDEAKRVRARLDRDEELTVELISERVPAFATSEIGHSEPSMFAAVHDTTQTEYDLDDAVFGTKK